MSNIIKEIRNKIEASDTNDSKWSGTNGKVKQYYSLQTILQNISDTDVILQLKTSIVNNVITYNIEIDNQHFEFAYPLINHTKATDYGSDINYYYRLALCNIFNLPATIDPDEFVNDETMEFDDVPLPTNANGQVPNQNNPGNQIYVPANIPDCYPVPNNAISVPTQQSLSTFKQKLVPYLSTKGQYHLPYFEAIVNLIMHQDEKNAINALNNLRNYIINNDKTTGDWKGVLVSISKYGDKLYQNGMAVNVAAFARLAETAQKNNRTMHEGQILTNKHKFVAYTLLTQKELDNFVAITHINPIDEFSCTIPQVLENIYNIMIGNV
jgi:hypothetical protein